MNVLNRLWHQVTGEGSPRDPAGDATSPGPLAAVRLSVRPASDGESLALASGEGVVALVRPRPGVVLFEAMLTREPGGAEAVVTTSFDLSERRGSVTRWPTLRDHPAGAGRGTVLFEGPPESVLWRMAAWDGALHVRDGRRGIVYRVHPRTVGAQVVETAA